MRQRANLIVTYEGPYEVESRVEIEDLFSLIHARGSFSPPFTEGAHRLMVEEDPRNTIKRLDYLMKIYPERSRFTKNWAPVDRWCSSDLKLIADSVTEIGEKIRDEESWKIVLRKNDCVVNMGKLIDTLSHSILKPRSSLVSPGKILLVHILGTETAISLLSPDEMLDMGDVDNGAMGEPGVKISLG